MSDAEVQYFGSVTRRCQHSLTLHDTASHLLRHPQLQNSFLVSLMRTTQGEKNKRYLTSYLKFVRPGVKSSEETLEDWN